MLGFRSTYDLAEAHRRWVEELVSRGIHSREKKWTESVAVGSETFVTATKERLGFKAKWRDVAGVDNGSYELKESPAPYDGNLGHENAFLRSQNEYFWNASVLISE